MMRKKEIVKMSEPDEFNFKEKAVEVNGEDDSIEIKSNLYIMYCPECKNKKVFFKTAELKDGWWELSCLCDICGELIIIKLPIKPNGETKAEVSPRYV